ncbi:hypothetical protein RhiJN_21261 [Ceratobasidium sp. AG-Ba]|nr:hypothetical protein RhiJN_21261 [Ceratobasidium sp. AG-Ba]
MSTDPIRLTYLVLDGNQTGAFGRLKIAEPDYPNLIGLDLVDLMRDQLGLSRRSSDVRLYPAELDEATARKLLEKHKQYQGHLPFSPVQPFERLARYWTSSPEPSHVHLVVEVVLGAK